MELLPEREAWEICLAYFKQFSTLFCEYRDLRIYNLWVSEKNYEYMKRDTQVKKSLQVLYSVHAE